MGPRRDRALDRRCGSLEVVRASFVDRAVLALGGRLLLRRMFSEAVEQLGRVA